MESSEYRRNGEQDAPEQGRTQSEQRAGREGHVARTIEHETSKLPSDLFLWGAGASILASLGLMAMGKKASANFIGQWAPTMLLLGIYNKIVKVAGHDQSDREP